LVRSQGAGTALSATDARPVDPDGVNGDGGASTDQDGTEHDDGVITDFDEDNDDEARLIRITAYGQRWTGQKPDLSVD
ncbi:MAG TPA: hypothetical protein VFI97_04630, partial [Arthrobacter sp.]|nr:hypothetical protein [Arthrobacter sp.]